MVERYFSTFSDATNFARDVAKATRTSLGLQRQGVGWMVSIPDGVQIPGDAAEPKKFSIQDTVGRYRAREQGDCGSCQYIKETRDGLTCRALNMLVLNPTEPIECTHFLAANLHLSYEARSVEREMLKRAENIHFHPQTTDNAPGKFFNKIKRK